MTMRIVFHTFFSLSGVVRRSALDDSCARRGYSESHPVFSPDIPYYTSSPPLPVNSFQRSRMDDPDAVGPPYPARRKPRVLLRQFSRERPVEECAASPDPWSRLAIRLFA